jgi:hypothetical protein
MIERACGRLDLWPERLIADTGYGSAEMLDWLVNDRGIEPHIPVFDKSKRTDGTFSRDDFAYDRASDTYRCPGGKLLRRYRRQFTVPRTGVMKDRCLPDLALPTQKGRDAVCAPQTHLETRSSPWRTAVEGSTSTMTACCTSMR